MLPLVLLCGGLGTRLRSVVADRPKVLAPVAGQPFLHYLLHHLRRQGIREVVLSTGYLGEMVEAFAGDGAAWDLALSYAREPEPLGTGGALRFAADEAGLATPFFVLNGDTFFSGDLALLQAQHATTPEALASLALVEVPDARRYGTVASIPETGRITAFTEKDPARTGAAWINAGAYVVDPALWRGIPPATKVSLEREVFPQALGRLFAHPFPEALFLDIGTPADYARAEHYFQPFLPDDAA